MGCRVIIVAALLLIPSGIVYGQQFNPPPEAYRICEGRRAGSAVESIGPRGERISGICAERNGRLFFRPDHLGGNSDGKRIIPSPHALPADVYVAINHGNNRLYAISAGSKNINIYDLRTLKLSDSIILDDVPSGTLRLYIDGNENIALMNSKAMTQFKILDLNTKGIRCAIDAGQHDIGWVDEKNKQFVRSAARQLILYDYNCRQKKAIPKKSTILSKVSEDGEMGVLGEKDLQVNILNLANGAIVDSFSIYDGHSALLPRHNLLLSRKWFAAHFDRGPKTDIVFYDRNTKETSWIHLQGTVAKALMKQAYLVNDLYYIGIKSNSRYFIAVVDLKNKKVLDMIAAGSDATAYAASPTGEHVFLLNRSGRIEKKPIAYRGSAKPLNFGAMLHLEGEGQIRVNAEVEYSVINRELQQIIDLFKKYDAKITIESEMPYVEAADKWGNSMLLYALKNGQGVGTHCDFDSMSQEEATENYGVRKEKVDSVVGAKNNLGCSGGWGTHDWARAASRAGFSYLDAPVMISYLAVPEKNRPINPDTGKHYTDAEIAPGSGLYYHDPIPPEMEDRIYVRRLKDTNDLVGDSSGIVFMPGSLGEISSLYEDRKNCYPRCRLTEDDIDYIFDNIDYVNSIKNDSKVTSLYLHFPDYVLRKEGNLKIVEGWLKRMQEYQNQGKIRWKTMKELYEEYQAKEPPANG